MYELEIREPLTLSTTDYTFLYTNNQDIWNKKCNYVNVFRDRKRVQYNKAATPIIVKRTKDILFG